MSQIVTQTIDAFKLRGGVTGTSSTGRPTCYLPFAGKTHKHRNTGNVVQIGDQPITKKNMGRISEILQNSKGSDLIHEAFPTRFCSNSQCGAMPRDFVHFERDGHETCTKCGTVQRTAPSKPGSLCLGENGTATKSEWNFTPGMDANDTCLMQNGEPLQIGGQRATSHKRNFWNIAKIIEQLAKHWLFMSIEMLIRSAKYKLKRFYHIIHNDTRDDNCQKMPHGQAQLASACFYAAVLEFEKRSHIKTPCTLVAVQEAGQSEVRKRRGRAVRDVTSIVILRYVRLLKKYGLCSAQVPEISAKTLQFEPEKVTLEHKRMAIFGQCSPISLHLPVDGVWGLTVGDTGNGVLYIDSVIGSGTAFKAGLRKSDYILSIEGHSLEVGCSVVLFQNIVTETRKKLASGQPYLKLTVMRYKKKL